MWEEGNKERVTQESIRTRKTSIAYFLSCEEHRYGGRRKRGMEERARGRRKERGVEREGKRETT